MLRCPRADTGISGLPTDSWRHLCRVAWAAHKQGWGSDEGPLGLGRCQSKGCGWPPGRGDTGSVLKYEDQAGFRSSLHHDEEALFLLAAVLTSVTVANSFCV